MEIFSTLRNLGRRRAKAKPPARGAEPERSPPEEAPVQIRYPLYDPRHIVPHGEEPPGMESQLEKELPTNGRGVSFGAQTSGLSSIPDEVRQGERIFLPHSGLTFEDESDISVEDHLFMTEFAGDCSPLSPPSEWSVASSRPQLAKQMIQKALKQAPPTTRQDEHRKVLQRAPERPSQRVEKEPSPTKQIPKPTPPPQKTVSPEITTTPTTFPKRQAEKVGEKEQREEAEGVREKEEKTDPSPIVAFPVREPTTISPEESDRAVSASSSSSSSSTSSFTSRARGSETSAVEDLPTAPHTPRDLPLVFHRSRRSDDFKQRDGPPRILLLQPHVSPHPATIRMQREGRCTRLRWSQLQQAIELYASEDYLHLQKQFRIQPHDTDACDMCQFGDFTDSPLLW